MPAFRELRDDGVAVAHINHELVIDAFVLRIVHRHLQPRAFEHAAVFPRDFPAPFRPAMQAAQLDAQHGALKSLHAVVVAGEFVFVARGLPVGTSRAREFRGCVIIGGQRAAFSVRAQIFGRIKAECSRMAQRARRAACGNARRAPAPHLPEFASCVARRFRESHPYPPGGHKDEPE